MCGVTHYRTGKHRWVLLELPENSHGDVSATGVSKVVTFWWCGVAVNTAHTAEGVKRRCRSRSAEVNRRYRSGRWRWYWFAETGRLGPGFDLSERQCVHSVRDDWHLHCRCQSKHCRLLLGRTHKISVWCRWRDQGSLISLVTMLR